MPNGVKSDQRIRISSATRFNIGLGGYPLVTLAEARTAALENAHEARAGGDPRRQRPTVPTVAQVAEAVIARDAPTWRDTRNAVKRGRSSLDGTRHPSCRCLDAVTGADLLAILTPLWNTKRETGVKLRTRLNAVLRRREGYCGTIRWTEPARPCRTAGAMRSGSASTGCPTAKSRAPCRPWRSATRGPGSGSPFRCLVLTAAVARSGARPGTRSTSTTRCGRCPRPA